jgi:hypothetical protein
MTREPDDPDAVSDPARSARERSHERAASVEAILDAIEPDAAAGAYPANSDELVAWYRSSEFDLPNETESLADAFDRIAETTDEFADPAAAREALTAELRRDERFDEAFTDAPSGASADSRRE